MGPGPRPAVQSRPGRSGSLTRGPGHSPLWAPPSQPVPSALERGRCEAGLVQTQRSRRTPPSQERWQLVLRPGWLGARSQLCRRVGSDSAGRAPGGLTRLRLGPRKVSGPPRPPASLPSSRMELAPSAPPTSLLPHRATLFPVSGMPAPLVPKSLSLQEVLGGGLGDPEGLRLPPHCPGTPPRRGESQKPGLGAQPALPSWARPPLGRGSQPPPGSQRGSGDVPTLRALPHPWPCAQASATPAAHPDPQQVPGKVRPGQRQPEGAGGRGRFSGTRGGPGAGAAPAGIC